MRLLLPIIFLRSFPLFKPISLTPPSAFFPPSLPFPFLPLPVSFSFPFLAFPSLPFVPRSLGARGTCGGFGSSGIPPLYVSPIMTFLHHAAVSSIVSYVSVLRPPPLLSPIPNTKSRHCPTNRCWVVAGSTPLWPFPGHWHSPTRRPPPLRLTRSVAIPPDACGVRLRIPPLLRGTPPHFPQAPYSPRSPQRILGPSHSPPLPSPASAPFPFPSVLCSRMIRCMLPTP